MEKNKKFWRKPTQVRKDSTHQGACGDLKKKYLKTLPLFLSKLVKTSSMAEQRFKSGRCNVNVDGNGNVADFGQSRPNMG